MAGHEERTARNNPTMLPLNASGLARPNSKVVNSIKRGFADPQQGLRDVAAILADFNRPLEDAPWIVWGIAPDGTETIKGLGGFKSAPNDGAVEIAYMTFPVWENSGVATETCRQLVAIARANGASKVVAHTLPEQSASTRILSKLGFEFQGDFQDPEDGRVWRWCRSWASS